MKVTVKIELFPNVDNWSPAKEEEQEIAANIIDALIRQSNMGFLMPKQAPHWASGATIKVNHQPAVKVTF